MKFDLHVHSTFSDGVKTPMELGKEAVAQGLAGFALTDHDTIDGWSEIPTVEKEYGITVFPGIEISTEALHRDVHVLGYLLKDVETMSKTLDYLRDSRCRRIEKMVERLRELQIDISMEEVSLKAGEGTIGRPHVAAVLVDKGIVKDTQAAFSRFLERGKPAYVERARFLPTDAVSLIKECGGYAVLAHPGLDSAFDFLDELCDRGLDGLEVHHSSHTIASSAKFAAAAEVRNLVATGGSDYHGHSEHLHGMIGSVGLEQGELPYFFKDYLKERE